MLLFLREKVLDVIIMNNFFLELVGSGLFRPGHLDALGKRLAATGFKSCYYFLCHGSMLLLDFSVKCYFLEYGIVFPSFKTVGSILPVLCGYIARHTRQTALLLLGAFKNDLLPVTLCLLCHFLILF